MELAVSVGNMSKRAGELLAGWRKVQDPNVKRWSSC
jgi:hypothetical protein